MWLLVFLLNGDGALHELRRPRGHAASTSQGRTEHLRAPAGKEQVQGVWLGPEKCSTSSTKWYALHVSTSLQFTQMHIRVCQPRCRQLCRARAHLEDKRVRQPIDHLAGREGLWSHPACREHETSAETQRQRAAARCESERCKVWSLEACRVTGDGRTPARGDSGAKGHA